MRRDIFLHQLNRDTREVFGLYVSLTPDNHARLMRRALNAAAMICETQCVVPPGFIVEDQIAFELAENQRAYLQEGLIRLPMRESSLADFAEKKRVGYEPMRDRYSGLFNDTRIGFLGNNANGIISRKTHITEGILAKWTGGPQSRAPIWTPAKKLLIPSTIDRIAAIPRELDQRGMALTWSAIHPELPPEAEAASGALRATLQNVYFSQYCEEFKLVALSGVPHVSHDFRIPTHKSYDYRLLGSFLDSFDLRELLFDAPAGLIMALRKQPGFIVFTDAFVALAEQVGTETDLIFFAGRARQAVHYGWSSLRERRLSLYEESDVEITELASALQETAERLTRELGLPTRGDTKPVQRPRFRKPDVMTEPALVLFVALEEELDVLARSLGLKKVAGTPEAIGRVGDADVAVICPRTMGRVSAAVAMTSYLAARASKPKLILVVGLAGGFPENGTEPGVIVVVTKVVDLALRKVVDEKEGPLTNFRREDYTLDEQLQKQILSDDLDKDAWSARVCKELDWPQGRRPSLHFGSIASADEVVASDWWRTHILEGKGGDSKLLGVEMEAGGVCAAARKARVPVSMLRVISDKADPAKADDSWRKLGMKTLADLIRQLPLAKIIAALA